MRKSKKHMVHETVPCYHTGDELRIGRWRLDGPFNRDGTKKQIQGMLYFPECDTSKHIHFFYDRSTGQPKAVLTDQDTGEKKPFEMTVQELRSHLIEKVMRENRAYVGTPPYGFIRQIQGKRYPEPLN